MVERTRMEFYGTIRLLANELFENINFKELKFPKCDFVLVDNEYEEKIESLNKLKSEASGWFGIHQVDTGFSSKALEICTNYYGGGCGKYIEIYDPQPDECEIQDDIVKMILNTIDDYGMVANSFTKVYAEITIKEG